MAGGHHELLKGHAPLLQSLLGNIGERGGIRRLLARCIIMLVDRRPLPLGSHRLLSFFMHQRRHRVFVLSAVLVTIFYYSQKFASVTNVKTKFNYTFTSTSCRRRWPSKYSTLIKLNVLICTIKGEGTAANSLPKLPNCASSTAELTS